ncbi:bifunctional 3'-5' exonuclease/ATP-dependent helicase WRN isoform X2 [Rhinichthys klamathensis goyatoka]|uniref:bifunctional 3'-5' exonuclease/ATP-dependent helicase WRN isoform X2 n=1 Tax=Rhinichthys klamathensis goyatoka TaxID=3034132 RepID=UPI0024B5E79B|nr:bifunctional 3'-5' exonuclease/ATP-dependent helicase WRN isoform X2 [Rhinichthys klamathensis goyatoka]
MGDTDRTLPEWMNNKPQEEQTSGSYKKNVLEDYLPYLEFGGTVIYSQERHDCSFLSEDLRSGLALGSAVGFDLEWPPSFTKGKTKKVAVVQLCASEEQCFLFHISSMSGFPPGLKVLLEDESVMKVGVGIEGDKWKLLSDYDIKLKNIVELSDLANDTLRCCERWSLDGLVKRLLKKQLFKDRRVRCSHWDDFGLTEDQRRYAATDAYAGLLVYQKLQEMMSVGRSGSPALGLKQRVLQIACDLKDLADRIPDELDCTDSAERLVDDLSQTLASLRCALSNGIKAADQSSLNLNDARSRTRQAGVCTAPEERGHRQPEECVVSQYELQTLEHQARQEQLEEECILAFQTQQASAPESSHDTERDEEFDDEMMKCADDLEKLNEKPADVPQSGADDDDEDVEEDEEEVFDSSISQPVPEQITCLKTFFGHHNFKPVQWKVIQSVLTERRDNLVVMATGYGKSLCFQFPPVYCEKISVVICPLIALMEDQVLQLQMSNIPACFLGSAQTKNLIEEVKRGDFRVVYMTPEFCSGNIPLLVQLDATPGLSLVAIDEAHCISQWGHDFRSAYRDLGKLKTNLPGVPICALTATASPSIREDIVKSLHLINPMITCTSFDRPNLYLDVNRKSGDAIQDLKRFLVKKKGGGFEFEGSAIVYCPSKKEAERVTVALRKLDIPCGVYHAGLSIKQRRDTQHQFMRDEIQCVVATVAFGMGINKSDIRKVIHYGAPKEMESYYQEIGRAGRDGLPSACHVLWMPGDMALNRFILNQSKSERFRGYKIDMMAKMEKYLNSTKCRRKLILCHFEDKRLRKVTSGILGSSECCDNCRTGVDRGDPEGVLQDFGSCAYQLMKAVRTMDERFGITAPILFLRGSSSQRVPDRFRKHSLFGIGRDISDSWWKALSRELVAEKYLIEATGHNKFSTLCKLTPKGRSWLSTAEDERHRRLLLQPNRDLFIRVSTVPRRKADPAHVGFTASDPQPDLTRRSKVSSGVDTPQMVEKAVLPSRSAARPTQIRTDVRAQTPAVSAREIQLQSELYGQLVSERQKLASLRDIPPALLATNKILLDMAKLRPCSTSSLKQVDGVSEAKASVLTPLIEVIARFCQTHSLQADVSSSPTPPVQTAGVGSVGQLLPDSVSVTYRLFQVEHKSMRQVADARSLPVAVVEAHLLQAQKAGCAVDTGRAGLSADLYNTIRKHLASTPAHSDLSDFKAIRSRVPEDISNFLLRLAVHQLQGEAPQDISWIERDKADRPAVNRVLEESPLRSDVMDTSDDELFINIPMPQCVQDDPCWSADVRLPARDPGPQSSGMVLASWNQDKLDEDTQDLFSDSPVKTASQPVKRKLPDWAERPHAPVTAAAAAEKKTKKKKGLFS